MFSLECTVAQKKNLTSKLKSQHNYDQVVQKKLHLRCQSSLKQITFSLNDFANSSFFAKVSNCAKSNEFMTTLVKAG